MNEWVWIASHLRSAPSFDEWLGWSHRRRLMLKRSLNKRNREWNSQIEEMAR